MPRAPFRKVGEHMKSFDNHIRHPVNVSYCIITFPRLHCYPTHAEVLPLNMLGVKHTRMYPEKGTHRPWRAGIAHYSWKRGLSRWGALCGCGEAGASSGILNTFLSVSPSSYERLGEMTLRFLPLLRKGFHVVSDLSPEMSIIKKL